MSEGRHSSGRSTTPIGFAILITSLAAGVTMLPVALFELFRYSPYEDPGAGQAGLFLLLGFLLFAGLPVLLLAGRFFAAGVRSYLSWRRRLTPEQRAALTLGELAALEGAHLLWREHNRREDARLTASVMGGKYEYSPFTDGSE